MPDFVIGPTSAGGRQGPKRLKGMRSKSRNPGIKNASIKPTATDTPRYKRSGTKKREGLSNKVKTQKEKGARSDRPCRAE